MKLHTKSDFTALMHRFLDPLLPLYSEGGARLHLGDTGVTYPGRTIEMEAFSRPLWALAPFWTGGGRADDFLRIYRKGLASGTDPVAPILTVPAVATLKRACAVPPLKVMV